MKKLPWKWMLVGYATLLFTAGYLTSYIASFELRIGLWIAAGAVNYAVLSGLIPKGEAYRDPLTGTKNRYAWEADFNHWDGQLVSVLVVDVDNFKRINDTYGHLVGDQVLKQVGQVLRRIVRKTDLVYRYGGEEFVIILPQTPFEAAFERAELIRLCIAQQVKADGEGVTCSVGIAEGTKLFDTLVRADQALYRAKRSGKNTVSI